jgi:hypothetical protein
MNIHEINSAIIRGDFSNDELNKIVEAVKYARSLISKETKRKLNVGTKVSFVSSRTGVTMTGTVRKVAIKYVTVDTPQGGWRVPANMLTVEV